MSLEHRHEYTDACAHCDDLHHRLERLEEHCFSPEEDTELTAIETVVVTEEVTPTEPVEVNVDIDVHVEEESSHEESASGEESESGEEDGSGEEDPDGEDPDGEVVITDDSGLPELSSAEKSEESHRLPMMRS